MPRPELPPRLLPILYFAAAHVALAAAFAAVALDPHGVSGFFYHAQILAIVHLVTLGWITASILGSLYVVGPVALRMTLRATALDYAAFALVAGGLVGMVEYFWRDVPAGLAWSTPAVATGILIVGARVAVTLRAATLPAAIRAHLLLAFVNIGGAATLGILIAFDKVYHFLPGFVLANVFAHAHLAAIGWASLMVIGVAYRLLPMVLPAEMPAGARLWISAALLEIGVVGVFISLVRRASTAVFAAIVIAGFAAFLWQVAWMFRRRRPRPPGLQAPDPAVLHAVMSFASLAAACGLGLWLAIAETSTAWLRVATAYGVLGLVGFLAQMVVAMEGRLLPIFAWYWAYANTDYKGPVASPHAMPWRAGQELVLVLWLFGVPALAVGLAFDMVPFVSAAAWALLAATLLDSVNVARILRHAYKRPA